MENRMDKEQVIEATIQVLSEISVPVRMKAQIADPIDGAINNLVIVLQMIRMEKEAKAQREERMEDEIQEDPEPVDGPVELRPEDVGCPEEEAGEDGR